MPDIDKYAPQTGRVIGEDGQIYNLVDLLKGIAGGGGGGTSDVNVKNWPSTQQVTGTVSVSAFPTWQGVGNILQGEVQSGEEKLIDLSSEGATAIWIQAAPDNTEPLQVGNVQGFEGAWVMPGQSEWFYSPKLYISHGAESAQRLAFQAKKYG